MVKRRVENEPNPYKNPNHIFQTQLQNYASNGQNQHKAISLNNQTNFSKSQDLKHSAFIQSQKLLIHSERNIQNYSDSTPYMYSQREIEPNQIDHFYQNLNIENIQNPYNQNQFIQNQCQNDENSFPIDLVELRKIGESVVANALEKEEELINLHYENLQKFSDFAEIVSLEGSKYDRGNR